MIDTDALLLDQLGHINRYSPTERQDICQVAAAEIRNLQPAEIIADRNRYRDRWLSCVTQEEAERLREENARLKEELATHTRNPFLRRLRAAANFYELPQDIRDLFEDAAEEIARLTPSPAEPIASNVIVGDRTLDAIVADMTAAAVFIEEHDLFDLHRDFSRLFRDAAALIEELAPSPAEQAQMDLNQKARERRAEVGEP